MFNRRRAQALQAVAFSEHCSFSEGVSEGLAQGKAGSGEQGSKAEVGSWQLAKKKM